ECASRWLQRLPVRGKHIVCDLRCVGSNSVACRLPQYERRDLKRLLLRFLLAFRAESIAAATCSAFALIATRFALPYL
ncbi:MAG TPA: hypothetical protein VIS96_03500, partial [Terrimicrobiaceae bacterium]